MRQDMKTRSLFAAVLILVLCWNVLIPARARADVYQGTVVDEQTGEPLADAVLVVVWWTRAYFTGFERPREFHQAKEAVTDASGKFSFDASPAISWNPLTYVDSPPTIVIYKPGYRPLMDATAVTMGFRKFSDVVDVLKNGAVIKLAKLKTQEETRRYIDASLPGTGVPMESIPNLIRGINIQRKIIGVTSFYPETKKGEKLP